MLKHYISMKYKGGDKPYYRFSMSKRHHQSDKVLTLEKLKTKLEGITSVTPFELAIYINSDLVELNNVFLLLFDTLEETVTFLNFLKE